jgi:hypothetical protein
MLDRLSDTKIDIELKIFKSKIIFLSVSGDYLFVSQENYLEFLIAEGKFLSLSLYNIAGNNILS